MIITSTVGAQADVALEHGDAGIQAAQRKMRIAVVREGENVGAFIKPESVWFGKCEPTKDTMLVRITAVWSPDPNEGCQLRGGALDGEVVNLPRQKNGRPKEHLRFPDPGLPQFVDNSVSVSPSLSTTYTLAGIDSSADQWVYEASR